MLEAFMETLASQRLTNKTMRTIFVMRIILIISFSFSTIFRLTAQENSTNSLEPLYKKIGCTIHYEYDTAKQIHNYSDNWDFDHDGVKDQMYFIGTGGAHLYFYLRLVLTTDNRTRDFNFIQSDFPVLSATNTLNFDKPPFGFAVAKMNNNLAPTIIVRLDRNTFSANERLLKKNKINTRNIAIHFENGKTKYGCL